VWDKHNNKTHIATAIGINKGVHVASVRGTSAGLYTAKDISMRRGNVLGSSIDSIVIKYYRHDSKTLFTLYYRHE
jgi:hypothetical protein